MMMRLPSYPSLAQSTSQATGQTASPDTIDWLLGLSRIHWRDAGTELAWRYPLPLWLWVILLLASFALAAWSYSRLLGPRPARAALAITRTALLLFMLALLAGPILVLPQERVEPDWLLVLIDRSASLLLPPGSPAPGTPGISSGRSADAASASKPLTRDQALSNALITQKEAFSQSRMGKDRRILWLGFDRTAYPITSPDTGQPMPAAQGDGTLLRTAIEQGLERLSGRPIAGVVLMTDGRSPESTAGEFPQRLKQQAVSIFPVPLGSEIAGLSLQVARVDAPDRAFIKDQVPVNVWIEHTPPGAALDLSKVVVTLTDTTTGKRLDTQRPRAGASQNEPIALRARSMVPGSTTWRVDVTQEPPEGPLADPVTTTTAPSAPPENSLLGDNNQASVSIEFVDRPLRVLYVEGYPRWEYRYLKNLLVREKSVQASVLLLSADQGFAQEGEESLTRLPSTAKELEPFDVILIGDVPASYFGSAQMDLIRDQVANRGSGLLWIGGALNTPRSYESTSLSELLPMSRPGSVEPFDLPALPLSIRPSELAARSGVLRLDPALDQGPAQAQAFWNTTLPALWWVQRIGSLKPGAETLAFGVAGEGSASDAAGVSAVSSQGAPTGTSGGGAVVTRLRFGAGQSVYVATDDTWRWRRGRGDVYFDRFWIQLLRMVGRGRLSQRDQRVSLELSRRRVEVDQAVVVTVRVDDTQLAARELSRVAVNVQRASNDNSATQPASVISNTSSTLERLELLPVGPAGNAARNAAPASPASVANASSPRVFQALWRPAVSGSMVLSIAEPSLSDVPISAAITVLSPDDELRQTATDHPRLTALATDTGGKVIALDKLDELASIVPHRAKRTPTDVRESLWDSPLALGLLTLLLTLEWVGRKLIRLT